MKNSGLSDCITRSETVGGKAVKSIYMDKAQHYYILQYGLLIFQIGYIQELTSIAKTCTFEAHEAVHSTVTIL